MCKQQRRGGERATRGECRGGRFGEERRPPRRGTSREQKRDDVSPKDKKWRRFGEHASSSSPSDDDARSDEGADERGRGACDARRRHEARDDARTGGQTVRTECDDATRNKEEEETILIGHGVQQARNGQRERVSRGWICRGKTLTLAVDTNERDVLLHGICEFNLGRVERYVGGHRVWRRRADSVFDGVRRVADVVVVRVFVYKVERKVGERKAILCRHRNVYKLLYYVYDCVVPDAFGFASGGLLSTVVEMAAKRVERRHRGIYELDVFVVLCV